MALSSGEEFKSVAIPSQQLLRKLLYYAMADSGSVLTPELIAGAFAVGNGDSDDKDEIALMWLQYIQSIQEQTAQLASRIDMLERASFDALQDAEQQLDATRRVANRARDGRRVYETDDGRSVLDEQGRAVARHDVDADRWNPDAPKWNRYRRDYDAWQDAGNFHHRVLQQKARLEDDPNADDLDDIEAALDDLEDGMPAGIRARHDALTAGGPGGRISAAASYDGDAVFPSAPGVEHAFAQAAGPATPSSPATEPPISPPGSSGPQFSR